MSLGIAMSRSTTAVTVYLKTTCHQRSPRGSSQSISHLQPMCPQPYVPLLQRLLAVGRRSSSMICQTARILTLATRSTIYSSTFSSDSSVKHQQMARVVLRSTRMRTGFAQTRTQIRISHSSAQLASTQPILKPLILRTASYGRSARRWVSPTPAPNSASAVAIVSWVRTPCGNTSPWVSIHQQRQCRLSLSLPPSAGCIGTGRFSAPN